MRKVVKTAPGWIGALFRVYRPSGSQELLRDRAVAG
jgi:hypothetical protein